MSLSLNQRALDRALSSARAGNIDRGEWSAPPRNADNSLGHDPSQKGTDAEWKYPVMAGGKVSAKGVASALGYARTDAPSLVPHLERLSAGIAKHKETLAASASPRLSRCPVDGCRSFDVERMPGQQGIGPTDRCRRCGSTWPHSPGSITAEQTLPVLAAAGDGGWDSLGMIGNERVDVRSGSNEETINAARNGHGSQYGSCGHKTGSCRCSHNGDIRRYSDTPCHDCSEVLAASGDEEGSWVTIDGAHVLIKDGVIEKGPAGLVGKKPGKSGSKSNASGKPAPAKDEPPKDPTLSDKAAKHFGTTRDPSEAGYILHDGRMADLSGRHYASGYENGKPLPGQHDYLAGQRSVDHRELPEGVSDKHGTEKMMDFMDKSSAVRFDHASGSIHLSRPISGPQRQQIIRHMAGKDISVEVSKLGNGDTIFHGELNNASAGRIGKLLDKASEAARTQQHIEFKASDFPEDVAFDSFILSLSDSGEGRALPLGLEGFATKDAEGNPIHYRRVLIARCGAWTHCGTGDELNISPERADEWARNVASMAAAGRQPFIPTHHVFSNPDARDNLGSVLRVERDGNDVYAVIAVHGDDALKVLARNGRSVGIVRDPRDAKGNVHSGEWLHHLAIVPNPALPNLGGTMKIAASADGTAQRDVPVFVLASTATLTPAKTRRSYLMDPELIRQTRETFGIGADVTDENVPDAVAKKALALSADVKAISTERDALKTDRDTKAQQVLALAADAPRKPDPITLAMYADNIAAKRDAAITSGVVSEHEAKFFDALITDADGSPNTLALSASGPQKRPLAFALWDAVGKLAGNGIRTGNAVPAGTTVAKPVIAASGDATQAADVADPAKIAEMRRLTHLPATR